MSQRALGALGAALAAILFGSAYVATSFQLRSFTPLDGALWRGGLASVALVLVAVSLAARRPGRAAPAPASAPAGGMSTVGRLARLAILGVLGGLVFIIGMNVAVARVGATISAFVAGLYAVLAALFAPFLLGERLERSAVAGFAIALLGTALLAELGPSGETLAGLAAGGVAAVSFGLYLVLIRRWSAAIRVGPLGISLTNALTGSIGLLVLLAIADPSTIVPDRVRPEAALATAWLAFVTASAQILVSSAVRRIEARRSSAFLLLNPITATALAAVLLGERPTPAQLVGGLLVLAGMAASTGLLDALRQRRRAAPEVVPAE